MQLMAKKLIQKFGFKPRLIKDNEIGSDELVNLSCGQLGFKSVHAIAIKNKFVKERIEFFEERINLDKPIINKTTYYKAKSDLYNHIQSKHEGIKYPCNQCDHQAMERGSLKKHVLSKHGVTKDL